MRGLARKPILTSHIQNRNAFSSKADNNIYNLCVDCQGGVSVQKEGGHLPKGIKKEVGVMKGTKLWLIEGTKHTIDELNRKLRKYLRIYNFIRPHYALGLRTPADKSLI